MLISVTQIIALAALIGTIVLQIFLSGREGKWPGLFLPVLAFLLGLLYPLNVAIPPEGVTVEVVVRMFEVWLLGNIPTMLYLVIYFACREKRRRKKQLEKMNIQDLD